MRNHIENIACPITLQYLRRLLPGELASLRKQIHPEDFALGEFESESGWVNADGSLFYPEVEGVPILLPERAVFMSDDRCKLPVHTELQALTRSQQEFWEHLAQVWERQPPPIRPMPEDTRLLEERIRDQELSQVLVLGVTPELVLMGWPAATRVLSVDFSMCMIRKVWPGAARSNVGVVCGEWTALPVATASCDLVLGDGVFSPRSYPDGYRSMIQELIRVTKPGGMFLSRVFSRLAGGDSVESVFEDLYAGRFGSFDHFRWRLGTAFHSDITRGVRIGDVWDIWHEKIPNPELLLTRLGWPKDASVVFDRYRGQDARFTFPTVDEINVLFAPMFRLVECRYPKYELGDCCPTLCFKRTDEA